MIDFYLSNYEAEAQLVRHGWNGNRMMLYLIGLIKGVPSLY